ncbi:MAG: ATP-binding cassette domain-containing protein, partial [Blastochloris sp.]|nr:ATP-binding cassette domain-containing protein [Blastochloris sp.]
MRETAPVLLLSGVERRYRQGEATLNILAGVDFELAEGETVALVAPSGAGKSTLLHIAGLLEHPDSGEIDICGRPTSRLSDSDRTALRRTQIGFVYQFHHLLGEFSAIENVMLPQMIRGLPKAEARRRSAELLAYLGLEKRLTHRPAELSGGEQQRVAIAGRWPTRRRLLLADG